MQEIERRLRAGGGLLRRAEHRDLAGSLDRWLRDGRLVSAYPGVYLLPEQATTPALRIRAAAAWAGEDAVITGWAAAWLTYWPGCPLPAVTLAQPTTRRRDRGDARFERRTIPPDYVLHRAGMRISRPSLTAVDLATTERGGDAIDAVLRSRAASLDDLWEALAAAPNRPGNEHRRRLLEESRAEPWSGAERDLHRLFFTNGVCGWRANAPVGGYYVDVLFEEERVVVEVDGWDTHGTRTAFEADRERRNALELAGYLVLNFTWRHITTRPEWVLECVSRARQLRSGRQ